MGSILCYSKFLFVWYKKKENSLTLKVTLKILFLIVLVHVLCLLCVAVQCVQVAIEMLWDNSHSLMLTVSEILQVTESATKSSEGRL